MKVHRGRIVQVFILGILVLAGLALIWPEAVVGTLESVGDWCWKHTPEKVRFYAALTWDFIGDPRFLLGWGALLWTLGGMEREFSFRKG